LSSFGDGQREIGSGAVNIQQKKDMGKQDDTVRKDEDVFFVFIASIAVLMKPFSCCQSVLE